MILAQGLGWFSWDTKTKNHYYPNKNFVLCGPTNWNLKHNLNNGTSSLGPDLIGTWQDE